MLQASAKPLLALGVSVIPQQFSDPARRILPYD
jgi:hypothetical protein